MYNLKLNFQNGHLTEPGKVSLNIQLTSIITTEIRSHLRKKWETPDFSRNSICISFYHRYRYYISQVTR